LSTIRKSFEGRPLKRAGASGHRARASRVAGQDSRANRRA